MSTLDELFVGEWLEERHDGFPNKCVFCGGEEHTEVRHYEDCTKNLAELEYINLKSELAQLQAENAAKDKRIAELEYRLEYIRNNRTDSISVMYALNADSEEIAAAMQTAND